MISMTEFANRLSTIPEAEFTHENILQFLRENRVDPYTLSPYTYFCADHYTRNLIHKTDLFELIAICWDRGQKSPIHNHRDQKCWMGMPYGQLQVHNFKLIQKDPSTGYCELQSSDHFLLSADCPQEVNPEEPIHQVLNLPSFNSRAVSLHIYSRPYDTCEVYDLKTKHYEDMKLVNTTEYGVLKSDWKLEKVTLV